MANINCYDLICKYCNQYKFIYTNKKDAFYAIQKIRRIGVPRELLYSNDDWYVFSLLHEIGHLETYQSNQSRVTREFFATQWAIRHMNEYKIKLSDKDKCIWQDYIYSFTTEKNKNKYVLNWDI